jgi:hypothetical protein
MHPLNPFLESVDSVLSCSLRNLSYELAYALCCFEVKRTLALYFWLFVRFGWIKEVECVFCSLVLLGLRVAT